MGEANKVQECPEISKLDDFAETVVAGEQPDLQIIAHVESCEECMQTVLSEIEGLQGKL